MQQLNRRPIFTLLGALFVAFIALILLNSVLLGAPSETLGLDHPVYASSYKDPLSPEMATFCDSDNIALGKVAMASSYQNCYHRPDMAIDGDYNSRWSSIFTDDEWIYVDLGSFATVECVVLKWEAAYGMTYTIDVSDDAVGWTPVYTETNGDGNTDTITLTTPISTHYVRMHGIGRGTEWGYSLYEFEIHGSGGTNPTPIPGRNIALDKPAYASSYLDANKAPKYAVDGKRTGCIDDHRWESTWNETAWISIDLGAMATITNVNLFWEAAYAVNFKIQISNDAENWTTIYTVTNNSDTFNDITFSSPITGRYIRMVGCERCLSQYGYSLYEFEVYGYGDDPNVTPTPTPGPLSGDWVLVWSDEFDGTGNVNANGLNVDNWTIETGICKNNEQQTYTTSISNVRVVSGTLIIEAHDTDPGSTECITCGNRFTSGSIVSKDKQEFIYGRFEARIRLPVGTGLWSAFWLLGANFYEPDEVGLSQCGVSIPIGWPRSGEIDIMENVGYPNWVSGGIHGPGYSGTGGVGGVYTFTAGSVADWHTYTVEWDPVEIKGCVDNTVFYTNTRATLENERGQWVFDHPFLIVLNLALGGDYPYQFNRNDGSSGGCYGLPESTIDILPQRMEVDWVRVYQRRGIYLPLVLRQSP